jgi:hypothetical protein
MRMDNTVPVNQVGVVKEDDTSIIPCKKDKEEKN